MKLADTIRGTVTPLLAPGETLRSVGYLRTGPIWAAACLSSLFSFALKFWYAGITNQRLILIRLNWLGKPRPDKRYDIPLYEVQIKGSLSLLVKLPGEDKPTTFDLVFGIEGLTGLNAEEFKAAVPTRAL